jgi:hypothetical protein
MGSRVSGSWTRNPHQVPDSQESESLSQIANNKNLGRVPDYWEPNPDSFSRNLESGAGSVLRNAEPIVPCVRMKEKICLNTPVGSKARRNELSGGFPSSGFQGTELETNTSTASRFH